MTNFMEFTPERKKKLDEYLTRYPTKQAAVMPALWLAQDQFGVLTMEVMEYVAGLLDLAPSHVYGVATFYTMYNKSPVGKNHFQVCRTLSCALAGGEKIIDHLKKKWGVEEGEVTKDGKFSVCGVECLASCGTAPALMINEKYFENLSLEDIDKLVRELANL